MSLRASVRAMLVFVIVLGTSVSHVHATYWDDNNGTYFNHFHWAQGGGVSGLMDYAISVAAVMLDPEATHEGSCQVVTWVDYETPDDDIASCAGGVSEDSEVFGSIGDFCGFAVSRGSYYYNDWLWGWIPLYEVEEVPVITGSC